MPSIDFTSLLPFIVLIGTLILAMLTSGFLRRQDLVVGLTGLGMLGSFISLFWIHATPSVHPLILVDGFSTYYCGLFLLSTQVILIFSYDYYQIRYQQNTNPFCLLLLLATLGSLLLVFCNHLATFFLALEILSISLSVLISYPKNDPRALEAGTKYLVLAGTSSAFLLFGMALIYSSLGTMDFDQIGRKLSKHNHLDLSALIGGALLLVGIGFKLALAPFHMGSPDVYDGASAPITSFIATVSKGAIFTLLLRFILKSNIGFHYHLLAVLSLLAIASMFLGNLAALRQNNVKRLLAYSSIAQMGYLVIALIAGRTDLVAFFLLIYFITTLIAFGVVSVHSRADSDADQILDYQGLFWSRPFLSLAFSVSLLSLAGLPLTAGFISKFYLIKVGIEHSLWILIFILVFNSAIGLYYYLRLFLAIFSKPEQNGHRLSSSIPIPSASALVLLSIALIGLGVFPSPTLFWIQKMFLR